MAVILALGDQLAVPEMAYCLPVYKASQHLPQLAQHVSRSVD